MPTPAPPTLSSSIPGRGVGVPTSGPPTPHSSSTHGGSPGVDARAVVDVVIAFPFAHAAAGNTTTAQRIGRVLRAAGLRVECWRYDALPPAGEREVWAQALGVRLLVAIHATKGATVLDDHNLATLPLVLVLGGTDVNHDVHASPATAEAFLRRVQRASVVVAFSSSMLAALPAACPRDKVRLIPQGVGVPPELGDAAGPGAMLAFKAALEIPSAAPVFLLVAGLRPVKDVLFLAEAFQSLRRRFDGVSRDQLPVLVLIGPELDPVYARRVHDTVRESSGALRVAAPIERADLCRLVQGAAAVVNSSLSEGQSSVILEALSLGTLVFARDIPGNRALLEMVAATVEQGHNNGRGTGHEARGSGVGVAIEAPGDATMPPTPTTTTTVAVGCLFASPEDFIHQVEQLMDVSTGQWLPAALQVIRCGQKGVAAMDGLEHDGWIELARDVLATPLATPD